MTDSSTAFERVLAALEAHGDLRVTGTGRQRSSRCPAHDDRAPSLSVTEGESRVLLRCHANCPTEDILAALNLRMADLFDAPRTTSRNKFDVRDIYQYRDENGDLLFEVLRASTPDTRKTFRQRRPNGRGGWEWSLNGTRRVLYRLQRVIDAVETGQLIYIVEGEKDVAAVERAGGVATCNAGGAGKWRDEYAEVLRGAAVVVVADRDKAGREHAEHVRRSLDGVAASVTVVEPAAGKDAADHLGAGHDLTEFVELNTTIEPSPATEAAVLVQLASVEPERLTWLWEGRLPAGKIATIDGDPSVGKSTLSVDIAAHVSTGTPWPDGAPCAVGDVLILSAEDGLADTIRPRLDAAGGDPARVHALTAVRVAGDDGQLAERPPTLADIAAITAAIHRVNARLVVVDVMMAFLPGKVDSHKDQDIRAVLSRLSKMCEETGATLVLLRHLNKSGGNSPMYRGGGSIGIVGAARVGYLIARDPDDPDTRIMACVKSNLAKEPESLSYRLESAPGSDVAHVVWTGVSSHDAFALIQNGREDTDDRNEVDQWLLNLLDENQHRVDAKKALTAARSAGFSVDQAKRAKKRLGVESVKSSMAGGWDWVLPEGSTKGAKGADSGKPHSSLPSVLPSQTDADTNVVQLWRPTPTGASCKGCGDDLPDGAEPGSVCIDCFKTGRVR